VAQTDIFIERLKASHPELEVEMKMVATTGDKVRDRPLATLGGFGAFVKELDNKIVSGEIDCSVNSLKDMPASLPKGLALVATPPRADARDVLIAAAGVGIAALPPGTRVGTSSLRRRAQLLALRPDLAVVDMRGNVDTRLAKLATGQVDAILLAAAGLVRLGLSPPGMVYLAPKVFVPAIGQGILAIEARADDPAVHAVLRPLDDPTTRAAATAERAFLAAIGGDCHTPLAAHATVSGDRLRVRVTNVSLDDRRVDFELAGEMETSRRPAAGRFQRQGGGRRRR
jgi:hydroxymethylbilane synthase